MAFCPEISGILAGEIIDPVNDRIFQGGIEVRDGRILRVLQADDPALAPGNSECVTRVSRILPGLVDSHIHVESSMLVPWEYARMATSWGTIASVCDPHEIANVLGGAGIEFMVKQGSASPHLFCWGAPSCVPATPFDSCAEELDPDRTGQLMDDLGLGFLGEMMNFPGVISRDEKVMAKLKAARDRGLPVDGHCPGLSGDALKKYLSAGIATDHECFTLQEAREKISLGMKIQIREGSAVRNFDDLSPLLETHRDSCMLCSDDRHPEDLLRGHINLLISRGLVRGLPLLNLLRAASVTPAGHYGLPMGLLQPGDRADFLVVDDLETFIPVMTVIQGRVVARDGVSLLPPHSGQAGQEGGAVPRINLQDLQQVPSPGLAEHYPVIRVIPDQIVTGREAVALAPGQPLTPDPSSDTLLIGVVDRYGSGKVGLGLVRGFGLREGALASTVCHDSHNAIFVAADLESALAAVNALALGGGGLAVASHGKVLASLQLPVAGLMSLAQCDQVARDYEEVEKTARRLGTALPAPFMTLSFMGLLVIPSLKIGPAGPFDVETFSWCS